jgi:hypothetical protein
LVLLPLKKLVNKPIYIKWAIPRLSGGRAIRYISRPFGREDAAAVTIAAIEAKFIQIPTPERSFQTTLTHSSSFATRMLSVCVCNATLKIPNQALLFSIES